MDWIGLAQEMEDKWRALVNAVMQPRSEEFLLRLQSRNAACRSRCRIALFEAFLFHVTAPTPRGVTTR
jgi:hypothetical protein